MANIESDFPRKESAMPYYEFFFFFYSHELWKGLGRPQVIRHATSAPNVEGDGRRIVMYEPFAEYDAGVTCLLN